MTTEWREAKTCCSSNDNCDTSRLRLRRVPDRPAFSRTSGSAIDYFMTSHDRPNFGELFLRGLEWLIPRVHPRMGMPVGHLRTCLKNLAKRGFAPGSLIDVGANRGEWSRDFLGVFPRAKALLVEPQKEMAGVLTQFCQRHADCRWIQMAVSDHIGTDIFTVVPDTYSSAFHHQEAMAIKNGWERRPVDVTTLDAIIQRSGAPPPDVVKIDAEGCEMKILSATESVWGVTQLFFVEADLFDDSGRHGFTDLVKLMDGRGYVPYDFSWFFKRPYDDATMLCEIAFVPRLSPLRKYKYWV